jgi:hypothetical protein
MPSKTPYDWEKAKKSILKILGRELPDEEKKKLIEAYLITLPFGYSLKNCEFEYNSCGYPYWSTNKKYKTDSSKLREILDMDFDPETFETEYNCPCCKKYAGHKN